MEAFAAQESPTPSHPRDPRTQELVTDGLAHTDAALPVSATSLLTPYVVAGTVEDEAYGDDKVPQEEKNDPPVSGPCTGYKILGPRTVSNSKLTHATHEQGSQQAGRWHPAPRSYQAADQNATTLGEVMLAPAHSGSRAHVPLRGRPVCRRGGQDDLAVGPPLLGLRIAMTLRIEAQSPPPPLKPGRPRSNWPEHYHVKFSRSSEAK